MATHSSKIQSQASFSLEGLIQRLLTLLLKYQYWIVIGPKTYFALYKSTYCLSNMVMHKNGFQCNAKLTYTPTIFRVDHLQ